MAVARWIYPDNPEVSAFYMQQYMDSLIYGQSVIRVNPEEMLKNTDTQADK
jgi:hypothetical protein